MKKVEKPSNKSTSVGRKLPSEGSETNAAKEAGHWVPLVFKPKEKPIIYIPTSDHAVEERDKLTKMVWVIYPSHGSPQPQNIIGGLKAIFVRFVAYN